MDNNIERMNPLADPVFAKIFESKETAGVAMRYLINAVREDGGLPPISEIKSLEPQRTVFGEADTRGCRVDVMATDITGHITSFEVQLKKINTMNDRVLFNFGHVLMNNVEKGTVYDDFPYVSMINILNFNIRENREDYHHQAEVRYINEPYEQAAAKLRIHNIELPRFRLQYERLGDDLIRDSKLALWLHIFDSGFKNPDFLKEVSGVDEGFREFVDRYNLVGSDRELRRTYHNWRVGQMDIAQRERDYENDKKLAIEQSMAQGMEKGMEKGMAQGMEKERIDMFTSMYETGVSEHSMRRLADKRGISKNEFNAMFAEIRKTVKPPSLPPL